MRKQIVKFAQDKMNVSVAEIDITAIHDLPKCKDDTPPVIVQLLSVDKKTDLMRKRKCLKENNVFLNEQLNNELFAEARRLKREHNIYGTWTMTCNQCRIYSVADVEYATGPALLGAPRFYLDFFTRVKKNLHRQPLKRRE